jgi:hypothetical protein
MGWRDVQPGWEMVVREQPGARHHICHHRRLADAWDLTQFCLFFVLVSILDLRGVKDEDDEEAFGIYVD